PALASTLAGAVDADLLRTALLSALAAVVRIDVQIDAAVRAQGVTRLAVVAALAGNALRSALAALATRPAVRPVTRGVHALPIAQRRELRTLAGGGGQALTAAGSEHRGPKQDQASSTHQQNA